MEHLGYALGSSNHNMQFLMEGGGGASAWERLPLTVQSLAPPTRGRRGRGERAGAAVSHCSVARSADARSAGAERARGGGCLSLFSHSLRRGKPGGGEENAKHIRRHRSLAGKKALD